MDTTGDMLTIIRNGLAVKKETVIIPYSRLKMNIARILEKEKLIKRLAIKNRKEKKFIELTLGYDKNGKPFITNLRRISRPSKRVYVPHKKIHAVQSGKGLWIFSTSKGVLTNKEAKKEKVGGEVICEVW